MPELPAEWRRSLAREGNAMRPQKIRAAPSAKPSEKRAAIGEAWIPWLLIGITCLSFGGVVSHDFGPIDDLESWTCQSR